MDNSTFNSESTISVEHSIPSKLFLTYVALMFSRMLKLSISFLILAMAWCIIKYKRRLRRVKVLKSLSKFVHLI